MRRGKREAARELLRADPGNSNVRGTLKAAGKVRFEAVQRFFEELVSQLEVGMAIRLISTLEDRRSCIVQYVKDEEGNCFET